MSADKADEYLSDGMTEELLNVLAKIQGLRVPGRSSSFAFKNKKKDLSCEELAHGRKEADAAPAALRSNGTGLTPAQVSRGAMLAHDVGRELGNEYNRRCKKG